MDDDDDAVESRGCRDLWSQVVKRTKPRVHIFGPIHERFGEMFVVLGWCHEMQLSSSFAVEIGFSFVNQTWCLNYLIASWSLNAQVSAVLIQLCM